MASWTNAFRRADTATASPCPTSAARPAAGPSTTSSSPSRMPVAPTARPRGCPTSRARSPTPVRPPGATAAICNSAPPRRRPAPLAGRRPVRRSRGRPRPSRHGGTAPPMAGSPGRGSQNTGGCSVGGGSGSAALLDPGRPGAGRGVRANGRAPAAATLGATALRWGVRACGGSRPDRPPGRGRVERCGRRGRGLRPIPGPSSRCGSCRPGSGSGGCRRKSARSTGSTRRSCSLSPGAAQAGGLRARTGRAGAGQEGPSRPPPPLRHRGGRRAGAKAGAVPGARPPRAATNRPGTCASWTTSAWSTRWWSPRPRRKSRSAPLPREGRQEGPQGQGGGRSDQQEGHGRCRPHPHASS